jgi:tRNA (guanine37-N1)-methyltransferase
MDVPDVLRSGDHARIARWRHAAALVRTAERRPDLLVRRGLTDTDRATLEEFELLGRLEDAVGPGLP